jgi:hypothetical protein
LKGRSQTTDDWLRYRCAPCDFDLCEVCLPTFLISNLENPVHVVNYKSIIDSSSYDDNSNTVDAALTRAVLPASNSVVIAPPNQTSAESIPIETPAVATRASASIDVSDAVFTGHCNRLMGNDVQQQLVAMSYFRRALSLGKFFFVISFLFLPHNKINNKLESNPPIQKVIDLGILPRFVEFLTLDNNTVLIIYIV